MVYHGVHYGVSWVAESIATISYLHEFPAHQDEQDLLVIGGPLACGDLKISSYHFHSTNETINQSYQTAR